MKDRKQGPLSVHVSEMPLTGLPLEGEIPFAELDIAEDGMTRLPGPLRYRLRLEQVGEDLIVTGTLDATVELLCDRCAEFAPVTLHADPLFHQYEKVAGEVVDLTEDIREDILITFPQTHLCSETCRGLCPHCGANLNHAPCDCQEETPDTEDGEDGGGTPPNPFSVLDRLTF